MIAILMLILAGISGLVAIVGAIALVMPMPAIGIPTRERAIWVTTAAALGVSLS